MARQVLTIGGALVGAAFGMPQLGFVVGSILGNIVDPVKVEGPRLTDAKTMTARDGVPIPWGDGIFRVAGTMIACQPGKPTEHKKKKRQGKGGGPVQVTYTYTRSHAVLICEGEIVGVRRIWRNGKLVYDSTPLPVQEDYPDLSGASWTALLQQAVKSKASASKFSFTLYLGDETQLPDPTLEAMFGVGEVGANRGIAYVVIEDDDVTDSAGAVPQYEFEVARAGSLSTTDLGDLSPVGWWKLDEGTGTVAADSSGNGNDGTYVGNYAHAAAITGSSLGSLQCVDKTGGVAISHADLLDVGTNSDEWSICASFMQESTTGDGTVLSQIVTNWGNATLGYHNWSLYLDTTTSLPTVSYTKLDTTPNGAQGPDAVTVGRAYRLWGVRRGAAIYLYLDGEEVATAAAVAGQYSWDGGANGIRIGSGNLSPNSTGFIGRISDVGVFDYAVTAGQIAADATHYVGFNGSELDLPDSEDWYVLGNGDVFPGGVTVTSVVGATVPLSSLITAIGARCGLESGDLDVTDVAGINVVGYFIARQAGGDACLKPLLDAFQIGMYEADGKIWFVQLGADTVADIDADDLVALDGPPVTETRAQEVELPRKINVIYSDPATAYTPTKQTSERVTSDVAAVGEVSIELPIVMTADQAAQIAHKKEKSAWIGLLGGKDFVLPDEFSYLTPTDNINLTYRGRTERVRLEKVDAENGQLMLSTQQDRQSAYSSERTGTSPDDFIAADTLVGPTLWNVMLLPQLRPQDNVPGVYFACCGLLEGWRGCELQMTVDGGVSWITIQQYDQPSAIGYLASSITDSDTTATVTMYGTGELESVTSTQEDAGANRAAIVTAANVAEVVSFEDATLDSFGDYDLAAMTRALLATTAAAHAAAERFVQLDNVNFVPISLDYSGQAITFRAVSLGTVESNNGEQTLTFTPAIRVIDGGGA